MAVIFPAASERVPMLRVSLIVEALRARPALMVAVAALTQGALWTLVPALFYAAPPGEVPLVLAVGRERLAGSSYGPPLAYWLAEATVGFFGHRIVGIYVLSQLCVVVTYLAVFRLGPCVHHRRTFAPIAALLGIEPAPEQGEPDLLAS